jgi:hypothetical protein
MKHPMTRGWALAALLTATLVPTWSQAADTKPADLDDNTQRQHSRGASPAAPQPDAPDAQRKTGQPASMKGAPAPRASGVRDWAAIDTNKDHLISPQEMEAALASSAGARSTTTR